MSTVCHTQLYNPSFASEKTGTDWASDLPQVILMELKSSNLAPESYLFIYLFIYLFCECVLLGFELRAYTLIHSISPFW
jgi:hypothetical protein